jgi:SAM-dependent methyltransferase
MPIYDRDRARFCGGYLNAMDNPAEINYFLSWARKSGEPILALACGAGRIMIKLAKAGFKVYGLDASRPMLEIGQETIKKLDPSIRERLHFIQGNMHNFAFRTKFPLIIIPYDSFWFNLNEEEAEACIRCIVDHLTQNGVFVIDTPLYKDFETWWQQIIEKYNLVITLDNYGQIYRQNYFRILVGKRRL